MKHTTHQAKQATVFMRFVRSKKGKLLLGVFGGLLVAVTAYGVLMTHGKVTLEYARDPMAIAAPLEIKVSQKLLDIPLDAITIEPRISGTWEHSRHVFAPDALRFTPDAPLTTSTTYRVSFHEVRRVLGTKVELPAATLKTEAAPGIASTSFGDTPRLAADSVFTVHTAPGNQSLLDLELVSEPVLALQREVKSTVYTWKLATGLLPQGKQLILKLVDKKAGRVLIDKTVQVAASPKVTQYVKPTHFGKTDTATIQFAEAMEPRGDLIRFTAPGQGAWTDDKTYQFTPQAVEPGKTYGYTIEKGLRTKAGGILEKAISRTFATPGHVAVVGMSPYGQELSRAQQTIRFTFNQPVNKASAEQRFEVTDGKVGAKTWEDNTLAVVVTQMSIQQRVTARVKPGVQPQFGLPSVETYSVSFTTEIPVKKLGVPMYYQAYAQSCEAASLRMALAYKGAGSPSDWSILQRFGYDPRPLDKKNNVWDDPQKQFVGDVKGDQGKGTGWGVYAEPVAGAARSYGRGAQVQYGVSARFVADHIYKGNPVILWGIWNESATQKTWKTPEGRTVTGPIPMHVRLVVGVKGTASKPVGFYVHDPITGPTYWTADYMIHNASRAGAANQAVAIQ